MSHVTQLYFSLFSFLIELFRFEDELSKVLSFFETFYLLFEASAFGRKTSIVLFSKFFEIIWPFWYLFFRLFVVALDFPLLYFSSDVLLEQPMVLIALLAWVCLRLRVWMLLGWDSGVVIWICYSIWSHEFTSTLFMWVDYLFYLMAFAWVDCGLEVVLDLEGVSLLLG